MTSQENDIRPKSMDEEYDELLLEEIKSFTIIILEIIM